MLKKIREKRHIQLRVKISVSEIMARLAAIRRQSDVLAICPETTGNNYQGVKSATLGLFPNNTLVLPQYYSAAVYTDAELIKIASGMADHHFRAIVMSGMPSYVAKIIGVLKKQQVVSNVYFIYHGSLASNDEYGKETSAYLHWLLQLAAHDEIKALGFVKKGMSELFSSLHHIRSHHLLLKTPLAAPSSVLMNDAPIHVGVLGSAHYRKNFNNQVAAALLFRQANIHVRQNSGLDYLRASDRIMVHPYFKDHESFLKLLGSMSINFYVSFSECWGQLITESLAAGVPCLAAYSSGIFDYDDYLKRHLVVEDFDNPVAIYGQAEKVLEMKTEISQRGIDYIHRLNMLAEQALHDFIH